MTSGEKAFAIDRGGGRVVLAAKVQHVQSGRTDEVAKNGCRGERGGDEHERFVNAAQAKVQRQIKRDGKNLVDEDQEIETDQAYKRTRMEQREMAGDGGGWGPEKKSHDLK